MSNLSDEQRVGTYIELISLALAYPASFDDPRIQKYVDKIEQIISQ